MIYKQLEGTFIYVYFNTMVEIRNDNDTRKGNCCNLWGKKEIYKDH